MRAFDLFSIVVPVGAVVTVATLMTSCGEGAQGRTYYERQVEPILQQFCAQNTGGCHSRNANDPFAFAAGNFDVTSFETVQKRRDLLEPKGAYSVPPLLVKAVGATGELQVVYRGEPYPLEVQHVGGNILQAGSDAYLTLLDWMEAGATENGVPPPAPPLEGEGGCTTLLPVGFDPMPYQMDPNFNTFKDDVQPVLSSCSASSCHGAEQSDFYISCGDDDDQVAFNFAQTQAFIDNPVDNSQILQVPLAVSAGGYFHSGGEHFGSRSDSGYTAIRDWAEAVGGIDFGDGDPGKEFFAEYVQPLLLQRGCSFEGCHSPSATNDLKLRSGSQGFFSAIALERNYDLLRNEFMAIEVPDARRGRALSKTILPAFGGIAHRGGAVMETPNSGGANPNTCPQPYDPLVASAYCTVQEWIDIERSALIATGDVLPLGAGDTVPIVYVQRQETHVTSPLEFDTFQQNSNLMVVDATLDGAGSITTVGAPRSLLASCGVLPLDVDVRAPDVRYDGTTIAFSMRVDASEGLSLYTVNLDGTGCQRLTGPEQPVNGIAIHDFDPAWSPDGQYIVFASTRGGQGGPSMSRKLFLPQSDIWRIPYPYAGEPMEQVTFLTNSEIGPQMMREGRIIMTTEKISDGFYQLAGRRINWDLTDYHPLLAQRAESPFVDPNDPTLTAPSIGYAQGTDIREGFNGDFLLILSDEGARGGAGALAIFNRSVGTFELGREDPGFLKSVVFPDPAATGRVGEATSGAYRSPFPMLDGTILTSYAAYNGDLGTATSLDFDLVTIAPRTGQRNTVVGGPGAQVDAVLALAFPPRKLFYNRRQLVFGGGVDTAVTGGPEYSIIHFPDAPLVFTLLNANLRRGRPVDLFREATDVAFYEELPAPMGSQPGANGIYEDRTLLGSAPIAEDGSLRVRVPAGKALIMELRDANGGVIETMREEHQVGPGEVVSLGIKEELFDAVCGGCHGSVSGEETDIAVSPDALTGASQSLSANAAPVEL